TRGLSEGKSDKKPGESDAQFKLRVAVVDELSAQAKAILYDGQTLTLKLNIDPKADELAMSATFTAKSGTRLASSISELGVANSVLANLSGPDTAMFLRGFIGMPKNLRKPFEVMVDEAMKEALAKEKDKKELLALMFKSITPTLKAAEIDVAMEMRGPQANGLYTGVLGFGVKEGADLESALRAVMKELPPAERQEITLEVAR